MRLQNIALPALPLATALRVIPSLPRPLLAHQVERAIERLDELEPDPDLEPDDFAENDDPAEDDNPARTGATALPHSGGSALEASA